MSTQQLSESKRIQSIDILRGAVMVLMAIDHVRVYAGVPAGGPDPAIFFTRWVTHFCAPAFVFLAGTAAFLYAKKLGDVRLLARYLVTRGLILIFLELTLIRFGWTFNLNYSEFALAGVIWMLGWCMVLLALFVRLRPMTVGVIGLMIISFQQFFAFVPRVLPEVFGSYWEFIYSSGGKGPTWMAILYVIVPWIGVMMAGYGFGKIMLMEPEKRNKLCKQIGLSAIALFLIGGSVMIFLKPSPPNGPPFLFRLLGQQKYPASQFFLLMTLGPLIAFIPFAEKARGRFSDVLTVIGKVPFFYYLLHIPLIHISSLLLNFLRDGTGHQEWYTYAPFASVPPESQWGLPLLYLVFVIDVAILYLACRWYVQYKFSHPEIKWLKFV